MRRLHARPPGRGPSPDLPPASRRCHAAPSGARVAASFVAALFFAAAASGPSRAGEDPRIEKARQLRDAILEKQKQKAGSRPDPFAEAEQAASARLESIDAAVAGLRARAESLVVTREKAATRADELHMAADTQREAARERVGALWRGAKLGSAAAGWHADPARGARAARYLVAIAAAQAAWVDRAELDLGNAMASLDRARADEASVAGELRVLEADRVEAEVALERARSEAATALARGQAPVSGEPVVASIEESVEELVAQGAGEAAGRADAPEGDGFLWPGAKAPVVAEPPAVAVEAADPADAAKVASTAEAADAEKVASAAESAGAAPAAAAPDPAPTPGEEVHELEDGPAVRAPAGEPAAPEEASGTAAAGGRQRGFLNRLFGGDDRESDRFAAARGELAPPVAGRVVASYGQQHKSGATYRGVVLRAAHSAPVKAVAEGRVSYVGSVPGVGSTVIVSHGSRYHTVYARLGEIRVKEGDRVTAGDVVGALPANDADMHFELRDQGKAVDPAPWLRPGVPGAAQR